MSIRQRNYYYTGKKKKKCLSDLFNPLKIFKHRAYLQIPGLLKSQGEMEFKKNKIIRAKGEELSSYSFKPYLAIISYMSYKALKHADQEKAARRSTNGR